MAIYSRAITSDWSATMDRFDDKVTADIRLCLVQNGQVHSSSVLTTEEIGALATFLSRVFFERTHKIIWPVCGEMLARYEKVGLDEAPEQVFMYPRQQANPGTEDARSRFDGNSPVSPTGVVSNTKACPYCLDECTGECL